MEFFDEESRPRFLLQSQSPPKSKTQIENFNLHKPTIFVSFSVCISLNTLILLLAIRSTSIYVHLVLIIPPRQTFRPFLPHRAGDIRVGIGLPLQPQTLSSRETDEPDQLKRLRIKPRKPDYGFSSIVSVVHEPQKPLMKINVEAIVVEERNWSLEDLELLKKQMVKNPVGIPGRWEAVAEAFCGRHKVESVVKMVKSMGDRKLNDSDSYSRILKDRKAVDKRVDEVIENERQNGVCWSSSEDIALLNALKAFPKDVAMRWEKGC